MSGGYAVTDPPGSGGAGGPATIIDGVNGAIVATVKDYANSNPLTVITVDTNGDPVSAGGGGLTDAQLRATPVPVSGPLTDAQLRAAAVPVSAASLPLPTGASTEATLALIKAKTDNLDVVLSTRTKPADQQHVIVDSGALPTGAATAANQATEIASLANLDVALSTRLKPADTLTALTTLGTITNVVHVDDNAGSLTVDGTVAVSGSVAVTGPLTDAQLRASAVPVSGTVAVTGVATAANQATEIASLASIDTKLTAPLSVSLASVPLATNAALESGGNLATLVALLQRMEELVHLERRHLAMTTGLYTHLVGLSSTGISADEILSVELTSH